MQYSERGKVGSVADVEEDDRIIYDHQVQVVGAADGRLALKHSPLRSSSSLAIKALSPLEATEQLVCRRAACALLVRLQAPRWQGTCATRAPRLAEVVQGEAHHLATTILSFFGIKSSRTPPSSSVGYWSAILPIT